MDVHAVSKHQARQFLGLSSHTFKKMEKDGRLKPDCEFAENKYTYGYLKEWKEKYADAKHAIKAGIREEQDKKLAKKGELK